MVDLNLLPVPPSYAKGRRCRRAHVAGAADFGDRGFAGRLRSCNALTSDSTTRSLLIDGKSYPLARGRPARRARSPLEPNTAGTPLERVEKPTRYEVQVVDEDGLQLEQPIQGFIRIKADQRPRISRRRGDRFVLPTASPVIEYRANDDFGIGKLLIHLQVIARRERRHAGEDAASCARLKQPILSDKLPLEGYLQLELSR